MPANKTWAATHIRCIIVRVSIYKHGQPVEASIVGKHGPCGETSGSVAQHTHTLTSIPWRSLRKVSTKIARPTNWSWFPNTGPRMEAEMGWDMTQTDPDASLLSRQRAESQDINTGTHTCGWDEGQSVVVERVWWLSGCRGLSTYLGTCYTITQRMQDSLFILAFAECVVILFNTFYSAFKSCCTTNRISTAILAFAFIFL